MAVEEAILDATLNDDALAELGLSEQPFTENKKFSRFSDSTTQSLRAELEQHLRFGESLHLFIGEKGAGKTVFLSQLIKHCKGSIKPFVAKGADSFETVAFLAAVLNQLGGEQVETISDHVDALIPLFDDLANEQMSVVLAIDDAHLAPIEEFAELIDIMPSFTKDNGEVTARLLLTGEPRLKSELTAIADEFEEELSFNYTTTVLPAMDEDRVREYLTSQLNQAGHTDAFPFTDKAVAKIHRESNGLPANINGLAGKYLNTVYSGSAAKAGGKGFFAALGWPLLALGTAAVGLIAWGLSMFLGNDQQSPVVTIDPPALEDTTIASGDTAISGSGLQQGINTELADNTVAAVQNTQAQNTAVIIEPDTSTLANSVNTETTAMISSGEDLLQPADRLVQPETPTAVAGTSEVREQVTQQAEEITESVSAGIAANQAVLPEVVMPETPTVTTEPVVSTEPLVTTEPPVITTEPVETVVQVTPAATVEEAVTDTVEQFSENLSSTAQGVTSAATDVQLPVPNSVAVNVPSTDSIRINTPDTDAASVAAPSGDGIPVTVAPINNIGSNEAASITPGIADNSQGQGGASVAVPTIINRAIENERWVLFQAPTKFTVQLATSRERNYIIDLAQTLEAEDPVAIYPFKTTNSNNPVFGLLSGLYETRSEAIAAVDQMDENTKQFGVWIRPIADLQSAIKNQQ